jgi:hypothetical protein
MQNDISMQTEVSIGTDSALCIGIHIPEFRIFKKTLKDKSHELKNCAQMKNLTHNVRNKEYWVRNDEGNMRKNKPGSQVSARLNSPRETDRWRLSKSVNLFLGVQGKAREHDKR